MALSPASWIGEAAAGAVSSNISTIVEDGIVVHTLTKFCLRALRGNTNRLDILFCQEDAILHANPIGQPLCAMHHCSLSCDAFGAHARYANVRMRNSNVWRIIIHNSKYRIRK